MNIFRRSFAVLLLITTSTTIAIKIKADCGSYFQSQNETESHNDKFLAPRRKFYSCHLRNLDLADNLNEIDIDMSSYNNNNSLPLRVIIEHSSTSIIPKKIFTFFPNMSHLLIHKNKKLQILKREYFHNAVNLSNIKITESGIEKIGAVAFAETPNLEYLTLTSNKIKIIDERAFEGLTKLKGLYLWNNKIELIEQETFSELINLENLDLSGNKLQFIDFDLTKNTKLKTLSFFENQIISIDPKTFDNKTSLSFVDLSLNNCVNKEFVGKRNLSTLKTDLHVCFMSLKFVFDSIAAYHENTKTGYVKKDELNESEAKLTENNKNLLEKIIELEQKLENVVEKSNYDYTENLSNSKLESEPKQNDEVLKEKLKELEEKIKLITENDAEFQRMSRKLRNIYITQIVVTVLLVISMILICLMIRKNRSLKRRINSAL